MALEFGGMSALLGSSCGTLQTSHRYKGESSLERFARSLQDQQESISVLQRQLDSLKAEFELLRVQTPARQASQVFQTSQTGNAKPEVSTVANTVLATSPLCVRSSSIAVSQPACEDSQRSSLPDVTSPIALQSSPIALRSFADRSDGSLQQDAQALESDPLSRRLEFAASTMNRQPTGSGKRKSLSAAAACSGAVRASVDFGAAPAATPEMPLLAQRKIPVRREPPAEVLAIALAAWDVACLLLRAAGLPAALCLGTVAPALGRAVSALAFTLPTWFPRRVYAVGGSAVVGPGALPLASAECFDPATGVWRSIEPMRSGRRHAAAAACGGLVYVLGGHDGQRPLSAVERYRPETDSWESLPRLVEPRFGAAAAALGGVLYIAGGHDGRKTLRAVERLCPTATNCRWDLGPPLCEPRMLAAALVLRRELFVIGGTSSGDHAHKTSERLSVTANRWMLELLPTQRECRLSSAVTVLDGLVVAAGGYRDDDRRLGALSSAELLGPAGWSDLPVLNLARLGAAAAAGDGAVYVLGGHRSGDALPAAERWAAGGSAACGRWECLPQMSTARDAVAAVACRS